MLAHYLTTALRSFWRHRLSTGGNILSLALGFMCFFVALTYALFITNSDYQFAKADRISFIKTNISITAAGFSKTINTLSTPGPLLRHLETSFPEVETAARMRNNGETGIWVDGKGVFVAGIFADPAFLRIFDLPFLAGDAQHALDRPRSVVITNVAAQRFCPTSTCLGRTIAVGGLDVTITGVMGTIPAPSHLTSSTMKFDVLMSMDVLSDLERKRQGAGSPVEDSEKWNNQSFITYVLLKSPYTQAGAALNEHLARFAEETVPKNDGEMDFIAEPISEFGLAGVDYLTGGDKTGIPSNVLLIGLGALIAGVTCLNYANLAAAQTLGRIKEASLRRAIGARPWQLLAQHMMEAFLNVGAAFLVAFAVLLLSMPIFDAYTGFSVLGFLRHFVHLWAFLPGLMLLVIVAVGLYPALMMSRIASASTQAVQVSSRRRGSKLLVGAQFGVVGILLIMALVIAAENRLLRETGMRSTSDPVVVISNDLRDAGVTVDQLRAALASSPYVKGVSAMVFPPWGFGMSNGLFQRSADVSAEPIGTLQHFVASDFFETMDIPLLAGRSFSSERDESLSTVENHVENGKARGITKVVVDRALAARLGWTPEQAVGKTVYGPKLGNSGTAPVREIIGVSENRALKLMSPMSEVNAFYFEPVQAAIPMIRIDAANVPQALAAIDAGWAQLAPNVPMKRQFMDDLFQETYKLFGGLSQVVLSLAMVAFVVAIIGVIGMATYIVNRQRREIGIRKALGSSVRQALWLVLWSFSKPVVVANIVAWPIAFIGAQAYLRLFITRIPLTPVPFIAGLAIIIAVTWIAVGWQAYATARVNPADVLHYE